MTKQEQQLVRDARANYIKSKLEEINMLLNEFISEELEDRVQVIVETALGRPMREEMDDSEFLAQWTLVLNHCLSRQIHESYFPNPTLRE